MAYNKEYYEKNKDRLKEARDRYRQNPENRENINRKQREKYQSLSEEEKEARRQKIRDYRESNLIKVRLQNRLSQKNRFLNEFNKELSGYEEDEFMLKMADHWDNEDFRYSNELHRKKMAIKKKIKNMEQQINQIKQELEKIK